MDVEQGLPVPPKGARSRVPWVVGLSIFATGLLVGLILAGLNVAGAQTPSPSADARAFKHGFGHRGFGHGGFGGALHGEFTTPKRGGGYQVVDVQRGEVTSVSSSSITVKSEDGFTKIYVVNDDTLVNAGNNGIADIAKGDNVDVVAIVSGGSAHAVRVADITKMRALHRKFWPERPKASAKASTTSAV